MSPLTSIYAPFNPLNSAEHQFSIRIWRNSRVRVTLILIDINKFFLTSRVWRLIRRKNSFNFEPNSVTRSNSCKKFLPTRNTGVADHKFVFHSSTLFTYIKWFIVDIRLSDTQCCLRYDCFDDTKFKSWSRYFYCRVKYTGYRIRVRG